MKISPLGAELFDARGRTDRQTDMKKLTVAIRNSANASKILRSARTVYLCFLCSSQNTHRFLPCTINQFSQPRYSVHCAVRTEYLYKIDCVSDVWLTVHRNSVWISKTN